MRIFLLVFTCLLLAFSGFSQNQSLFKHLDEVNVQWSKQGIDPSDYTGNFEFSSDEERIQAHLLLVIENLKARNTDHLTLVQETNRREMLDRLSAYALAGTFPKNTSHGIRIPYFIDNIGTPCAVGHLLFESGYGEFAEQVRQESNNAYVLDMSYPELPIWADAHGFSVEELAWIQPGYQSPHSLAPFNGGGTNGPVYEILPDDNSDLLYIAGEFSQAGSVSANGVALYDLGQDSWSALGNGLSGRVNTLEWFNGQLYAGGDFGNGNNLAVWNGTEWTVSSVYTGVIYDLHKFNGNLYAAGDLTHSGGAHVQHIMYMNGAAGWLSVGGGLDAPVRTLETHNGELYAGGEFENTMNAPAAYVAMWNGNIWTGVGSGGPQAPVNSLESKNGALYAGGHFLTTGGSPTFGLNKFWNSSWTGLCDDPYNSGDYVIEKVLHYNNYICFAGSVDMATGPVGYYGRHVGYYLQGQSGNMFPLGMTDSTCFALAEINNQLVIGGDFAQNYGWGTYGNLAITGLLTGNEEEAGSEWLNIFPNPVKDEFRLTLPEKFNSQSFEVKLLDVNGKEVPIERAGGSGVEIHFKRGNTPAGVYFIRLISSGRLIGSANILFE